MTRTRKFILVSKTVFVKCLYNWFYWMDSPDFTPDTHKKTVWNREVNLKKYFAQGSIVKMRKFFTQVGIYPTFQTYYWVDFLKMCGLY